MEPILCVPPILPSAERLRYGSSYWRCILASNAAQRPEPVPPSLPDFCKEQRNRNFTHSNYLLVCGVKYFLLDQRCLTSLAFPLFYELIENVSRTRFRRFSPFFPSCERRSVVQVEIVDDAQAGFHRLSTVGTATLQGLLGPRSSRPIVHFFRLELPFLLFPR